MSENGHENKEVEKAPRRKTFSEILVTAVVNIIAICLASCLVAVVASMSYKFITWLF